MKYRLFPRVISSWDRCLAILLGIGMVWMNSDKDLHVFITPQIPPFPILMTTTITSRWKALLKRRKRFSVTTLPPEQNPHPDSHHSNHPTRNTVTLHSCSSMSRWLHSGRTWQQRSFGRPPYRRRMSPVNKLDQVVR